MSRLHSCKCYWLVVLDRLHSAFRSIPMMKMAPTERENITDWVLTQFQKHYADDTITKWDIFHYTYGLLHHPDYRERYQENLKRDLPHIPFAEDFWMFAKAGARLADLHVNYESQPEYDKLEPSETPGYASRYACRANEILQRQKHG